METDDVFIFCQNELPYNSFIAFEEIRKKGQFCDLKINVQNHSFTAHRIILAAGIPYFNSLYDSNTLDTDEWELTDVDIDPGALESLMHFAYTGKVSITMENVNSLLVASHFLNLKQVFNSCVGYISKRLSIDTVLKVRTFASCLNFLKLIENCDLYIRKNFEKFSKCADFLSLPHSRFKEIIAEDDLIVSGEEVVFDAVMKWINASPSERHASLSELLNEVRLIYLPVAYLVDRIDSEELIWSSEACRALVNEVKNYHLLPERRSALINLKMWPREQLFAFCSSEESCEYSVHHLVKETWRPWSSKKVQCYGYVEHVVGVKDKIYLFFDETIETFCITTSEWEKLTATHNDIGGAAVVPYEDKIYCFGSYRGHFCTKFKLRCFDTKLNRWLEEVERKTQRWDSAVASLNESIYVTGGYDYDSGDRINTVEKYSPSSGQWSDVASMLTKRDQHGCVAHTGKIYVCGGNNRESRVLNTAEVYDPLTNQWNYISPMAKAKYIFTLISYRNRIYALDDYYDAEVYDPKHDEWQCRVNVPKGFEGAVSIPSSCIWSYQE